MRQIKGEFSAEIWRQTKFEHVTQRKGDCSGWKDQWKRKNILHSNCKILCSRGLFCNFVQHNEQTSVEHHQVSSWQTVCWWRQWLWPRIRGCYGKIQLKTCLKLLKIVFMYFRSPAQSGACLNFEPNCRKMPWLDRLPGPHRPQCWKG